MGREYKRQMRTMKDGQTIALDTMDRVELLNSAILCLEQGKGDKKYQQKVEGIIKDVKAEGIRNFYVTLPMRRVLMGFIRPVFEEEWRRRQANTLSNPTQAIGTKRQQNLGNSKQNQRGIGYGNQ